MLGLDIKQLTINLLFFLTNFEDMLVFIKPINFFKKLIYYLFIYFLAVLGLRCCMRAFSSCGERGLLLVAVRGLLLLQRMGCSSCGMRAQQLWLAGSRVQAQQLWRTGLVALQHVGYYQTRAGTHVFRIGRRILNHCATREAPKPVNLSQLLLSKIIPDHMNMKNIWVSFCISESIFGLHKCLLFSKPITQNSLPMNFGSTIWRQKNISIMYIHR